MYIAANYGLEINLKEMLWPLHLNKVGESLCHLFATPNPSVLNNKVCLNQQIYYMWFSTLYTEVIEEQLKQVLPQSHHHQ